MLMTIKTRTLAHNLAMETQRYLFSSRATRMVSIETSASPAGKPNSHAFEVVAEAALAAPYKETGAMRVDKVSTQALGAILHLTEG